MRPLATLATVLTLFISTSTGTAGNTRSELELAIANLTARTGPPAAHTDENSILLPPGLVQHNLWQRLTSRFEFTDIEHPDISEQIDYFRSGLYSLRSNLASAKPFLYFIADELDRADLPLDLILLPLVESAYNPHARSGRNAVGIWQFIPPTAEYFGLQVNDHYDGRKDIVTSTRAAISYLKKLHRTFDGDWLLAMAAYNTGPNNVRAAIAKAVAKGDEPIFWNLRLAKETRDYVPRILAAVKMIAAAETHGLELPNIANRKIIDIISIGRPLPFTQIAKITNLSVEKIALLNPGHSDQRVPIGGPYHITIPSHHSGSLIDAIKDDKLGSAAIPVPPDDGVPVAIPGNDEVKYQVVPDAYLPDTTKPAPFKPYKKYIYQSHVVERGENLWKIARKMRTDVATLRRWNGDSDKPLQPGDNLIAAYLRDEESSAQQPRVLSYRVHASDTLTSISDKFDVKISELKKQNPALWHTNQTQTGQLLRIPVATSSGF